MTDDQKNINRRRIASDEEMRRRRALKRASADTDKLDELDEIDKLVAQRQRAAAKKAAASSHTTPKKRPVSGVGSEERPVRGERPVRSERPVKGERPIRSERPVAGERVARGERSARAERPVRPDRSERVERSNKRLANGYYESDYSFDEEDDEQVEGIWGWFTKPRLIKIAAGFGGGVAVILLFIAIFVSGKKLKGVEDTNSTANLTLAPTVSVNENDINNGSNTEQSNAGIATEGCLNITIVPGYSLPVDVTPTPELENPADVPTVAVPTNTPVATPTTNPAVPTQSVTDTPTPTPTIAAVTLPPIMEEDIDPTPTQAPLPTESAPEPTQAPDGGNAGGGDSDV